MTTKNSNQHDADPNTERGKGLATPAGSESLADYLTRSIFEMGDEPNSPCNRIEFKGGSWVIGDERGQGGLCRTAFHAHISAAIARFQNDKSTNAEETANNMDYASKVKPTQEPIEQPGESTLSGSPGSAHSLYTSMMDLAIKCEQRARILDNDAAALDPACKSGIARMKTKAGCFRSAGAEIKQELRAWTASLNVERGHRSND